MPNKKINKFTEYIVGYAWEYINPALTMFDKIQLYFVLYKDDKYAFVKYKKEDVYDVSSLTGIVESLGAIHISTWLQRIALENSKREKTFVRTR